MPIIMVLQTRLRSFPAHHAVRVRSAARSRRRQRCNATGSTSTGGWRCRSPKATCHHLTARGKHSWQSGARRRRRRGCSKWTRGGASSVGGSAGNRRRPTMSTRTSGCNASGRRNASRAGYSADTVDDEEMRRLFTKMRRRVREQFRQQDRTDAARAARATAGPSGRKRGRPIDPDSQRQQRLAETREWEALTDEQRAEWLRSQVAAAREREAAESAAELADHTARGRPHREARCRFILASVGSGAAMSTITRGSRGVRTISSVCYMCMHMYNT